MLLRILTILTVIFAFYLTSNLTVFAADKTVGDICNSATDKCLPATLSCLPYDAAISLCMSKIVPNLDPCDPNSIDTICNKGFSCQFDAPVQTYLCKQTKDKGVGEICKPGTDKCVGRYSCQLDNATKQNLCLKSVSATAFGVIQAPDILKGFLQKDPTGAGAISQFLSNLISLIYLFAAIILVFMLMWGAFEWITSEGEKEKLDSARKKIINALIGMVLLALVFAIIRVFGMFTGFRFFSDQNFRVVSRDPTTGAILKVKCLKSKYPNVEYTITIPDPEEFCSKTP